MRDNELTALIKLLDDPEEEVFRVVRKKLLKKGVDIVPDLESAWENSLDEFFHLRIENLIQDLQFNATYQRLEDWIMGDGSDVLIGSYLVTRYQYPDIQMQSILDKFQAISSDVERMLPPDLTPLEKIKVINHVLFSNYKFTRNTSNFQAPQNSYMNDLLQTKKGNHISLAILYLAIARYLQLPVYGVNLPRNFVLAYYDTRSPFSDLASAKQEDVLFYINPYNKGAVLGRREIEYFVKQQKFTPSDSFYLPCPDYVAIHVLINELIVSYEKLGYPDKIKELKTLIKAFPPSEQQNNEAKL